MKAVAETLGVLRSNLIEQRRAAPLRPVGRRPLPEEALDFLQILELIRLILELLLKHNIIGG